jgi:hypothetical protein
MANLTIDGTISIGGTAQIGGYPALFTLSNETGGIKLSNGFVVNWGTATPSGAITKTFEVPFSTSNYSVAAAPTNTGGVVCTLGVSSRSATSFTFRGSYKGSSGGYTAGDVTFRWIAIGK